MNPFPKPIYKDCPHFKEFWAKGNGKKLIDWAEAKVSFENFGKNAVQFYKVDDIGDEVIREVYFKKSFAVATREIEGYCRNGIAAEDKIPESVKNLFLHTQKIPDWVNYNVMEAGAELCRRVGIDALISLRDYSLMGGYDYAHLNKPLIATGLLKKGALKRLKDTLEFWITVTREDALQLHGKGYESCIKIRMIHSYARLSIKKHQPDWDVENWGEPINQWDMMATYNGFSLIILHSLKMLGHEISEKEEAGIFLLWKYVGYLLGISPELMMTNKKDAVEKFYQWTSVQPAADEDSKLLAKSLLHESIENPMLKFQFQRRLLKYLHISCTHFLLDKATCKRLAIPEIPYKSLFPKFRIFYNRNIRKLIPRNKQIATGNKEQMQVLEDYSRIEKNAESDQFYMRKK